MKVQFYTYVVLILTIFESVYSQFSFFGQQPQQQQNNPFNFFGGFGFPSQNTYQPVNQQYQPVNQPYNPQSIFHPQTIPQVPYTQSVPNRVNNNPTRPQYYNQPTTTSQNYNQPIQKPLEIQHTYTNRNSRISEQKCMEFTKSSQSSSFTGSLSLMSEIQELKMDECDNSQGLIVGGENAKIGEFPHMAAIGYKENLSDEINFICGGSLISKRHVLTAAHCSASKRNKPSIVRLGDLNLKERDNFLPELDVPIDSFITHENYNPNNNKNDIAVVKLSRDIPYSKYIRPACLATPNIILQNKKATATGWGLTESFSNKNSDIMQKVALNIYDNNQCNNLFAPYEIVLDNTAICAGELAGGKDTCQGDSGGPLQIISDKNKCVYIIIGVTNHGIGCGQENSPGVYAKVSTYIDWIERNVWD